MTWYELWLVIHISAVAVWIGGGFFVMVSSPGPDHRMVR